MYMGSVKQSRVTRSVVFTTLVLGVAVVLVGAGSLGATAIAADSGSSDESVTAEVTSESLFGSASDVTFEFDFEEGTDIDLEVVGEASKTVTASDVPDSVTLDVGGVFFGASYPLDVEATTMDGDRYTGTIERGDGVVTLEHLDVGDLVFESASAETTATPLFGDVRTVTFEYVAPAGADVEFTADGETVSETADGTESTASVRLGWLFGSSYPVDVEAAIVGGEELSGQLTAEETAIDLKEPVDPDPDPDPELESIDLALGDTTLDIDQSTQATVTANYDDGSTEDVTDDATITSSDESIASVDATTVTGVDEGDAEITAAYEGHTDSVTVSVVDDPDDDPEPGVTSFTSYGQEGIIVLGDAHDDPIVIPECNEDVPDDTNEPDDATWAEECFTIDGEIDPATGTWSAAPEDVNFPHIVAHEAVDVDVVLTAPNGMEGEFDQETGHMTVEGDLQIHLSSDATPDQECQEAMTLEATTGTSDEWEGTPLTFDLEAGTATGEWVDDRFSMDAFEPTGEFIDICEIANDNYYLPSDVGESYFQLDVWMEVE